MVSTREERDKEKSSRENLGKFFYDFAKATFTIMVLTNVVALFKGENYILAAILLVVGISATIILARIAYSIFKN